MATTNPFQKATRQALKARVAFDGPSGAGKTWTALEWATVLADGAPIAVVDTEHGSSALYATDFAFDVLPFSPPYDPGALAAIVRQAEEHGYSVLIVDSLSHFWQGEGGTLDIVDAAAERAKGNRFVGWKTGTPALRNLIDVILAADLHVIVTMRSKMEYVLDEGSDGRTRPRKVGMAPVMRDGIEYEFTVVGDLDLDHKIVVSKSRCSALADLVVQPGRAAEAATMFSDWLTEGEAMPPTGEVAALKDRLNALSGALRNEFRGVFGHPDRLSVERLPAAVAWVDGQETSVGDVSRTTSADVEGGERRPSDPEPSATASDGGSFPPGGGASLPVLDVLEDLIEQVNGVGMVTTLNKGKSLSAAAGLSVPDEWGELAADIYTDVREQLRLWLLAKLDPTPPNGGGGQSASAGSSSTSGTASDADTADRDGEKVETSSAPAAASEEFVRTQRAMFALARELDVSDAARRWMIEQASGGRTRSSKELSFPELARVVTSLRELKLGAVTLLADGDRFELRPTARYMVA